MLKQQSIAKDNTEIKVIKHIKISWDVKKVENCSTKMDGIIKMLQTVNTEKSIPVIIDKRDYDCKEKYMYPESLFNNILSQNDMRLVSFKTKIERIAAVKMFLDLYKDNKVSLDGFHLGMYTIYRDSLSKYDHLDYELSPDTLGQRRFSIYESLPTYTTESNDGFVMRIWNSLIEKYETFEMNPYFTKIRLLIESHFFGEWSGTYYEADLVEPVPGKERGECKTYTAEKDPMTEEGSNEGYIVGEIYLRKELGGYRHYLNEEAIHCGAGIEVKFGDGWIAGRYECSLSADDTRIKVYSSRYESFVIGEGSVVRMKM